MKVSINLLQETQKVHSKIKRFGLLVQTISIVTLIGFGFIVFLVFSYALFLQSQFGHIAENIGERKSEVETFRAKETKQSLVSYKLKLGKRAIDTHSIRSDLATEYYNFVRERAQVIGVEVVENSLDVKLAIRSEDVFSLVTTLEAVERFAQSQGVQVIQSDGFSFEEDGSYEYSLTLTYPEENNGN